MKMFWKFIYLLNCFCFVQADVVVHPINTVVVAGERFEFECRTNNGTKVREWTTQQLIDSRKQKIASKWNNSGTWRIEDKHFGLEVDENGSGFIYTNMSRSEDARFYTCTVQEGQQQPLSYQAHLIVIDKTPVCQAENTSLNGADAIRFQCEVSFLKGNWNATVEWSLRCSDKNISNATNMANAVGNTTNTTFVAELIVLADDLQTPCNVSCTTSFIPNSIVKTIANNTPSYTIDCGSIRSSVRRTPTVTFETSSASIGITDIAIVESTTKASSTSLHLETLILITVLVVTLSILLICAVCCVACVCFKRKIAELISNFTRVETDGVKYTQNERQLVSNFNRVETDSVVAKYTQNGAYKDGGSRRQLPEVPPTTLCQSEYNEVHSDVEKINSGETQTGKEVDDNNSAAVMNEVYDIDENPLSPYSPLLTRDAEPAQSDSVYSMKHLSTYSTLSEADQIESVENDETSGACGSGFSNDAESSDRSLKRYVYSKARKEPVPDDRVYTCTTNSLYAEIEDP